MRDYIKEDKMMKLMVFFGLMIALGTILYGVYAIRTKKQGSIKKAILTSASLFSFAIIGLFVFMITQMPVFAAETVAETAAASGISLGEGIKYIAAALSTGLATIATGKAVGSVGSSAIGAVSEDSSILGKTLIFVGMAEGIAIYGMIVSILILFV